MERKIVEEIRRVIERSFSVYDVRWDQVKAAYFVHRPRHSDAFEAVRRELHTRGYLSSFRREGGEDVIFVMKRPPVSRKPPVVNVILFVATLFTTIWAGSILWAGSYGHAETMADTFRPDNVIYGAAYFALPLLLILGTHETAHYLTARRYKISASLPYFIPAPPPILFGTFGAFISIREPMPNRRALLDVGIAGPLAGFVVAIPVTIVGLYLSSASPKDPSTSGTVLIINYPLLFIILASLFRPEGTLMHPTAFAGWVGLLVTAINLLPAGQLDGGHIARALFKEKARYVSYVSIGFLIILSMFFMGWLIFALLIVFLGTRHPPPLDEVTGLGPRRKILGVISGIILLMCFVPVPIQEGYYQAPEHAPLFLPFDNSSVIMPGGEIVYSVPLKNDGNVPDTFEITVHGINESLRWKAILSSANITLSSGDRAIINLTVTAPDDAEIGENVSFIIRATSQNNSDASARARIDTVVGTLRLESDIVRTTVTLNNAAVIDIVLVNLDAGTEVYVNISAVNLSLSLQNDTAILIPWTADSGAMHIYMPENAIFDLRLLIIADSAGIYQVQMIAVSASSGSTDVLDITLDVKS